MNRRTVAEFRLRYGVPVVFDFDSDAMARARGVWPFKRIVVGPLFLDLAPREQMAVLLHEAGHCIHLHMEQRLLWLPLFWTERVARMAQDQEIEADAFAATEGYGAELAHVICRYHHDDGTYYPPIEQRVDHLMKRIRERLHAAAA